MSSRRGWGPAAVEGTMAPKLTESRARAWTGILITLLAVSPAAAQERARDIVAEVQRRATADSQRYEGLLQVFDAKGAIADKRWTLERLGSHGRSRMVLRFTAPAEVRRLYVLKQLTSRQGWAGRVVHEAVEMALKALHAGRERAKLGYSWVE